jgi:hypothetical protein
MIRTRVSQAVRLARGARSRWLMAAASLLAVSATAGTAAAFIVNVAPAVVKVPAPLSVLPGALVGPDIRAFDERQDVLLTAPLFVDHQGPTPVNQPNDLKPGWIPAGTCIRSHYVHYDPMGAATATGGMQLEGDIVGVIVRPPTLDATNFLGAFNTTYPPNAAAGVCAGAASQCGLELAVPTQDSFVISSPDVLRMTLVANNPGDRMRVITKSCGCKP